MQNTPSSIRVNMTGYLPGLPKEVAVLSGDTLSVLDSTGKEIKSFSNIDIKPDEASGDNVTLID